MAKMLKKSESVLYLKGKTLSASVKSVSMIPESKVLSFLELEGAATFPKLLI
jgi:hypothetical protein